MSDWKTTLQGNVTDFGTQSAAGIATLPGGATSIELPGVCTTFTLQTNVGGTVTAISNKLQGSLDNATWFDIATSSATTGDAQFATGKPAKFIRVNLVSITGTAPTSRSFVAASTA